MFGIVALCCLYLGIINVICAFSLAPFSHYKEEAGYRPSTDILFAVLDKRDCNSGCRKYDARGKIWHFNRAV